MLGLIGWLGFVVLGIEDCSHALKRLLSLTGGKWDLVFEDGAW